MFKCHCRDCQKLTSGGFAPAVIVPASLKRAKRFAYLKLMEKNQNTDPFKFIIYSTKIGEQTPQINPQDVKPR